MKNDYENKMNQFIAYKLQIPVCGAIILDPEKTLCLLVKGFKSNSKWGFPRGKIAKDEEKAGCAIREVYEETGFDISVNLKRNLFIEKINSCGTPCRLYVIEDVPLQTEFAPKSRKEISDIKWHKISQLQKQDDKSSWFVKEFLQ